MIKFQIDEFKKTQKKVEVYFSGIITEPICARASPEKFIFESYLEKTDDSFNKILSLRGEFFFTISDFENNLFFVFRDPMGIRPVFYLVSNQEIIIGESLVEILHEASEKKIKLSLNTNFMLDLKNEIWTNDESTVFKEVFRLKKGNYLKYDSKKLQIVNYWSPIETLPFKLSDKNSWISYVESILEDAISVRINSKYHLGLFLSGGLDSSLVAFCLEKNQKPYSVFSFDFKTGAASESEPLNTILKELNYADKNVYPDISLNQLKSSSELPADIFYDPALYLYKPLLENAVKKNIRMILTGLGGDDLFSISNSYLQSLISKLKLSFILGSLLYVEKVNVEVYRRLWQRSGLQWAIESEQALASHYGIFMSYPLLDHRLVQAAMFIPQSLLSNSGVDKVILRNLWQKKFPQSIQTYRSQQEYSEIRQNVLREESTHMIPFILEVEKNLKIHNNILSWNLPKKMATREDADKILISYYIANLLSYAKTFNLLKEF